MINLTLIPLPLLPPHTPASKRGLGEGEERCFYSDFSIHSHGLLERRAAGSGGNINMSKFAFLSNGSNNLNDEVYHRNEIAAV